MRCVLVLSRGDPVSSTLLDILTLPLKERGGVEVGQLGEMPVIVFEGEPTEFSREDVAASLGDCAVFISRHEMANPRPLFAVHTPGSWPEVSIANPCLVSTLYRELCRSAYGDFKCVIEATHHPPNTSLISAVFLEVGSGEKEWRDRGAVATLLSVLQKAVAGYGECANPTMVIGDLHYTTVASQVADGTIDVGHIVPKYIEITLDVVKNALGRHTAPIRKAIIFRKNVKNPHRREILEYLSERGVEVVLKG
ncbi:MAG: D-aminoacyl-tRNA deacylase [Pyrobaculum sp.]